MTRRELLRGMGIGGIAAATATLLPACAAATATVRDPKPVGWPLGPDEERILAHAALAPSGHNAQPWVVRVLGPRRWTVGVDPGRRLPAIDPADRELVLSIGAFVETLAVAAAALGLATEIGPVATARDEADLLALELVPTAPGKGSDLQRIRLRRTLRKGYRGEALPKGDLDVLVRALGGEAAWFPAGSAGAAWLAAAEVEAFRKQTWRDDAQQELSRWFRFSDRDVARHGDGLTPATIEAGAMVQLYMRHFMDRGDVLKRSFREAGIEQVADQVEQGAGWLVATAPDESVASLLDAGRRFARMALRLRELGLAAHPMSQVLEEGPWRSDVKKALRLSGIPQFTLRVGYVADHPDPVSPRRAPAAFAHVAG
jgi:hypothetical protein